MNLIIVVRIIPLALITSLLIIAPRRRLVAVVRVITILSRRVSIGITLRSHSINREDINKGDTNSRRMEDISSSLMDTLNPRTTSTDTNNHILSLRVILNPAIPNRDISNPRGITDTRSILPVRVRGMEAMARVGMDID